MDALSRQNPRGSFLVQKNNNELNFNLKLRKLQTKLDMWRARDLTLFGRVLVIKSLGLSKIIHSFSNIEVPDGIAGEVSCSISYGKIRKIE